MSHRWILKPQWLVFIPLILVLMIGIACGGDAEPTDTPPPPPQPTATATALPPGETPEPVGTPTSLPGLRAGTIPTAVPTPTSPAGAVIQTGGHVPMHAYGPPITARPLLEATYSHVQNLSPLYNGILEYDPTTDDPSVIRCDLCTDYSASEDGLTYTFHLAENAVWSDGEPVTAEDVVFSLQSMIAPEMFGDLWKGHTSMPVTGTLAPYLDVDGISLVDDFTVELTTKAAAPGFIPTLALEPMKVAPKHVVLGQADPETGEGKMQGLHKPEDMVTSGPFLFVKYDIDVKSDYTRNEDYFKDGLPYIDSMEQIIIVDHGTIIAAYKTGQVLMGNGYVGNLNTHEYLQLCEDAKEIITCKWAGPAGMYHMMMNVEKKPFDNPIVRRAFYLAIYRQQVNKLIAADKFLLGLPFPTGMWYGRTLEEAQQIPGFREIEVDGKLVKHPDDIAEAQRLLAEAGFPNGEGLGELVMTARPVVSFVPIAEILVQQFKEYLNVDIRLNVMESAAGQDAYRAGDFQFAMQGSPISIPTEPDAAFASRYLEGGLMSDWTRWADPEVKAIFDQQTVELDPEKRKALIRQAEELVMQRGSIAGVLWGAGARALSRKIHGFHFKPSLYQDDMQHETIWCNPACN